MFKIKKLLVKMIVFILIPMVIMQTLTAYSVNKVVERSIEELADADLYSNSKIVAQETLSFFEKYAHMTEQFAASDELSDVLTNVTSRAIRIQNTAQYPSLLQTMKDIYSLDTENILFVWFADFDSSQYFQHDEYIAVDSWDVTTRPLYQVKDTKSTILIPPYNDAATGKVIVSLVSPVFGNDGSVIGATGIDLLLDVIPENFATYKLGETGIFILCSDDGRVVYHPNSEYTDASVEEAGLSSEALELIANPTTDSVITYTLDGENMHGAASEVGDTGWVVLTGMPDDEYYAVSNSVSSKTSFYFIFGVLIISIITIILAMRITKPLKVLATNAQQIADGELDLEINVKSEDEVGLVATSIKNIIVRLREYIVYINEISEVLDQIAEGNLAFELQQDYVGEFARIKKAFDHISASLNSTMAQINLTSEQVAQGAGQIAGGAQSLSQGATEQAASTQELEATIEQITVQIKENAENATQAREITLQAHSDVTTSDNYMREMISAMEDITDKSSQISKIIKTIDDIAFQTNILALNAAVEAARAGAAGKGFAVVADEVRNLASKSADAVKTTTELIEGTVESIEKGTDIVNSTAQSLHEVVNSVQQIEQMIQTIANASNEQASGAQQVAIGIDQISMVTQTNSAAAEESAASSEELAGQAQVLKGLVSKFKLKG